MTNGQIDRIIEYIEKNTNGQNHSVVFFGGEPLLEYKLIDRFVKKASNLKLSYILYTNGLLLNIIPNKILEPINTIIVSVDGDRDAHEKHRGLGTYERVIENLRLTKDNLDSFFIGRITAEEETNIFKSVTNILDSVDAVYWQIVNKPVFNNPNTFIKKYKNDLKDLFDFWFLNFENGKIYNIIPFQAVISSLLFRYGNDGLSFRCRAGSSLQVIDIDGSIYWCDEYIGDPKGIIGNINGGLPIMAYENHKDIFQDCKECNVSDICLGRCKKVLKEYPINIIRVYCELTKYLVEIITTRIDDINYIIMKNNYKLDNLYNVPYCTEEIP
jgi:radical SAM protein with 4Fe4S-binding SPASM domain